MLKHLLSVPDPISFFHKKMQEEIEGRIACNYENGHDAGGPQAFRMKIPRTFPY